MPQQQEQQQQQQQQQEQQQEQQWLPLEGTPEVLEPYLFALGGPREVSSEGAPQGGPQGGPLGAPLLQIEDVLSLEPWALDMLECTDTAALLLLFPLTANDEEERQQQPLQQQQEEYDGELMKTVWFVKQVRRGV
ncbi:ubiquitin carboxyl-terminal hydrolase isozyme, putative [Eimeria mitis]|uniref:ubiquitinyl hydrolase 1 n=1 Tax=Eimeria mitis TaxID=44415 RepID=U6JSA8_9EIME|nr:ubiquitin carboxyl-terminal hydrolase isozyme, putative [Eimeria mitis]CDJ26947.1 ubiquitin carboxyl-terminal hydrolase isozyme, putative [Eimeria mitis]